MKSTSVSRFVSFRALAFASGAVLSSSALSASVIFSDGFESYNTGALYGQGWRVDGNNTANAVVVSSPAIEGGRALNLLSTNGTSIWAAQSFTTPEDSTNLSLSLWMGSDGSGRRSGRVILASGTNPWDAIFAGVRSYADASTSWSETFWYVNSSGAWVNSGVAMAANTWYQVSVDIELEARTWSASVQAQGSETPVSIASTIALNPSVTALPNWIQLTQNYGGASDNVFYDNITISATSVPEPASSAMLAGALILAGAAGLRGRRRR